MSEDLDTDERRGESDGDRPRPGTLYQCPLCNFGTLDFETLRDHWIEEHADEHGLFAHADINVEEGP